MALVCPWLLTVTATVPGGRPAGTTTTNCVPAGFTLITWAGTLPKRTTLFVAMGSKPEPVIVTVVPAPAFGGKIEVTAGGGFVGTWLTTKKGATSMAVA